MIITKVTDTSVKSQKYDPEVEYIKKDSYLNRKIFQLRKYINGINFIKTMILEFIKYQGVIVNYEEARKLSLEMYRSI